MTDQLDALTDIVAARIRHLTAIADDADKGEYWLGQLFAYRQIALLIEEVATEADR